MRKHRYAILLACLLCWISPSTADARATEDFSAIAELTREPTLRTLADQLQKMAPNVKPEVREGVIARYDAELERAKARMGFSIDRLGGQETAVRDSIAELEVKLDRQSKSLIELKQLRREAEASRLIYEFFLNRLKETSVQEGIQRPDARVLTAAQAPGGPSSRANSEYGMSLTSRRS